MSTTSNSTVAQKVVPELVIDNILQQKGVCTVFTKVFHIVVVFLP